VIFVDSNVFIYAVGRGHPLKKEAQGFFLEAKRQETRLVTSAEVLQELLHVYIPVGRTATLDSAFELATQGIDCIFPINVDAVMHARHLSDKHPGLTARDLIHLAICQLHKVKNLKTFDKKLLVAFTGY